MSLTIFCKNFLVKYFLKDAVNKKVFDHYFFDSKYYLHKDACLEDFSTLLNISAHQLDKISKVNYNCFFETLLNEYRFEHLINELDNPINSNLTIESILKLSGFDNNEQFVDFVKSKENCSRLGSNSFNN
jgi:AraC-like DNA-binding protein